MLRLIASLIALLFAIPACADKGPVALVIHGGAGTMDRKLLTPDLEAEVRRDLERALDAGYAVLESGGSALDAVTASVVVLEDSPHFNAGRGAVFNAEGINELDAAIMDGAGQRAGSVAALHHIRNPVLLARAVMEKSAHVMLIGDGAEALRRARASKLSSRLTSGPSAAGSSCRTRRRVSPAAPRCHGDMFTARSAPSSWIPVATSPPPPARAA